VRSGSGRNRLRYKSSKGSKAFFKKIHIKADEIKRSSRFNVMIGTGYNDDRTLRNARLFECILWRVRVIKSNRFSGPLKNCAAKSDISVNDESAGREVDLLWKNFNPPPVQCMGDQPYEKMFGYHYSEEFQRHFDTTTHFSSGSQVRYLQFLLTVRQSPFAYLIGDLEFARWVDENVVFYYHLNGLPLALPFSTEFKFVIRFEGNGFETEGNKLRIKVNNWDSIETHYR
jgi:hypothetical protein